MPAIRRDHSFQIKSFLALIVVVLADWLLYETHPALGMNLGLFVLALVLAAVASSQAVRADRRSWGLAAAALAMALLQIETLSFMAWILGWAALMAAVLSPRAAAFDGATAWAQRLIAAGFVAWVKPVLDLRRLIRMAPGLKVARLGPIVTLLVVPVFGGLVFLTLFTAANPVIETTLEHLAWPDVDLWRVLFWTLALIASWAVLRPSHLARPLSAPVRAWEPMVSGASLILSLVVFNGVFALQNVLDLAFLWSGASLPAGVTLAGYAHRGAYVLIGSSLLAGLFVLVTLDPKSGMARLGLVRALVILWVGQNVFLVASCILRTWDYVEAYCLTALRIAALAWMGLVAVGLVLTVWRLMRGKSSTWLINANVAAAIAVIAVCSVVDLNAVAAAWNVDHASDTGGTGAALDVCYLARLGPSSLVSLAELGQRPINADLRSRVAFVVRRNEGRLASNQSHWRSWTFRGMRRLDRVHALTAGQTWMDRPASRCDPLTSAPAP